MQGAVSAAMAAWLHSRQGLGLHVRSDATVMLHTWKHLGFRCRASFRVCSDETLTIWSITMWRLWSLSLHKTFHAAACSDGTLAIWADRAGHLWTWELFLEGSAARKVAGLELEAAVTCLHADPSGSHQVRLRGPAQP